MKMSFIRILINNIKNTFKSKNKSINYVIENL